MIYGALLASNSFADRFYQNFIEDNRWLMLLNGLKVTVIVTLEALLIGIIIGFMCDHSILS